MHIKVAYLQKVDSAPLMQHLGNTLAKATTESRGTVAALAAWAQEVDDALGTCE